MNACRSCGAAIVWAHTAKGKAMPLDAKPRADGNVVLEDGVATVLGPLELLAAKGPRYMPHHATCPQGKDWRQR